MSRPPSTPSGDIPGPSGRTLTVALGLLFVVGLAVVAPTLASPQPDAACDVCGPKYERGASEAGVNVTVTNSTADVHVHENGTATWVVRNRLTAESVDRLRDASVDLDTVTAAAFETYPEGPVDEPTRVSTSREGQTVTVRYQHDAPVSRSYGVTLVEYFDTNGYDYWFVVNADRLRVVGPADTRVSNQPAEASVDGRTVTWRGDADDLYSGTELYSDEGRIAFVETSANYPGLRTTAALWGDTLPIYLDNLRSFLLPTVAVFGALALVGLGAARRVGDRVDSRQVGLGLAVLGGVGVAVTLGYGLAMGAMDNAGGWAALSTLVATVGWLAANQPARFTTPRQAAVTGLASLLVGLAVAAPLVTVFGSAGGTPVAFALVRLALVLSPLALAPAAGLLAGRGGRRRLGLGWAALVGAVVLAVASTIPVADRPFGLIIIVLLVGAVVGGLLTAPLAALGAGFARS